MNVINFSLVFVLGISLSAPMFCGHPAILVARGNGDRVPFPANLRVRMEVCVLTTAAGVTNAQRTPQGQYAVAIGNEDLKPGQSALAPKILDRAAWENSEAWPWAVEFQSPPAQLNPQLPGTLFRFHVRYEWTGPQGQPQSTTEDMNVAAVGRVDYLQNPPRFSIRVRPGDPTSGPPVRLQVGKAE